MKPKILLLPTYFPTTHAPIIGSQVLEQSEMMLEYYDIRAIYCLPGMGWKRFLFKLLFGRLQKNKGYQSCDDELISDKIIAKGVYYFQSKWLSECINQRLRNRAYEYIVKNYLENDWNPDLIHSRGFEGGGLPACHIKELLKIPIIHTENTSLLFDQNFSFDTVKSYKQVLTNADSLLFVSNFLLRNTIMHGFCNKRNYHIIGNAVDENLFKLQDTGNISNRFRVLFTGYYSYIKDYPTFFKSIKNIIDKGILDISVVIAMTYGGEKSRNELFELAKTFGIHQYCEFLVAVPRNQMSKLISSCDVFVSTSLIETFGIATLESMFCGTPVVATRNGGIEDFICDDNGILCDIGDDKAICEAISSIIEGKKNFEPKKVRESVIHKYGKDAFIERLKELYEETIQMNAQQTSNQNN